jgi:hypothetical protein
MKQCELFYSKVEKKYTKFCIYKRTLFLKQTVENSLEKKESFVDLKIEKSKVQQIKIKIIKMINQLFWRKLRICKETYKTKWQKCSINQKNRR